jgi:hypothetical protein
MYKGCPSEVALKYLLLLQEHLQRQEHFLVNISSTALQSHKMDSPSQTSAPLIHCANLFGSITFATYQYRFSHIADF